jgi:anti-anti-sigma factor
MMLADLQITLDERVLVARITGEIDLSNADEVGGALTAGIPNAALGVVLDLTQIDYLDSAGIHLMYKLRESLGSRGQSLKLVIPDGSPVNDALRLAGVRHNVEVVRTLDEGLLAVRSGEAEDE